MEWIFIYVLLAVMLILIGFFVYGKWLQAYFVIEISRNGKTMTIHNSWFFQKDLLVLVRAKKITMINPKKIEIDDLVEIKKRDSQKADFYFKLSQPKDRCQFINISSHASCRFLS